MRTFVTGLLVVAVVGTATAQGRGEVGAQVVIARSGDFVVTDVGVGARLAWRPSSLWGVEGEVDYFPSEFPNRAFPFSESRTEALVGVTVGPQLGRLRPFARVRPGLLRYAGVSGPVACIAIFPPPLSCQFAAGRSLFVVDIGGGFEVGAGSRTVVRIDVGDRVVRNPEPAPAGHDVRMAIGWALRF